MAPCTVSGSRRRSAHSRPRRHPFRARRRFRDPRCPPCPIANLRPCTFCISQRGALDRVAFNWLDTQFPQNCRQICRSTKFVAVSQRQTWEDAWKVFDCDPAGAYKCAHMQAHVFSGGTMTRRLGTIALLALLFLSAGLRAQESASSGIVGQVVDTTKGARPSPRSRSRTCRSPAEVSCRLRRCRPE